MWCGAWSTLSHITETRWLWVTQIKVKQLSWIQNWALEGADTGSHIKVCLDRSIIWVFYTPGTNKWQERIICTQRSKQALWRVMTVPLSQDSTQMTGLLFKHTTRWPAIRHFSFSALNLGNKTLNFMQRARVHSCVNVTQETEFKGICVEELWFQWSWTKQSNLIVALMFIFRAVQNIAENLVVQK